MSVFVPGTSPQGDLTQPVSVYLKNLIVANWPTSGVLVLANRIKFGFKWFDDYGSFQVHFVDRSLSRHVITLGGQYEQVNALVDCYIFVKKNTRLRPPEIDDIKRSITEIIMPNRHNPGNIATPNSAYMRVVRTGDAPQQHPTDDLWQSFVQVEIRYFLATTT